MIQAIDEARSELEMAQKTLDAALKAWDESVAQLYRTSLALTQAQKRVTRAHELLREALDEAGRRPLFFDVVVHSHDVRERFQRRRNPDRRGVQLP